MFSILGLILANVFLVNLLWWLWLVNMHFLSDLSFPNLCLVYLVLLTFWNIIHIKFHFNFHVNFTLLNRLRRIPAEHLDLPAQAITCRLADIEPANVELGWSPTDLSEFASIAAPKYLRAFVKVNFYFFCLFFCCQMCLWTSASLLDTVICFLVRGSCENCLHYSPGVCVRKC